MTNITDFPTKPVQPDWLIGPFEEYRVIVDGRQIPNLTGLRMEDGRVALFVDHRFSGEFSTELDAQQAAWLIAHAMAISSGYTHLGALTKDQPFAPQSTALDAIP